MGEKTGTWDRTDPTGIWHDVLTVQNRKKKEYVKGAVVSAAKKTVLSGPPLNEAWMLTHKTDDHNEANPKQSTMVRA